jgi:RNA polymerase sigma-70 factor (ECF subfamily)
MITSHNIEEHRRALTGHCYRMLGSAAEADDAVQDTMLRAWRGLAQFDGRSSLRTWLYRISTHVCLDALAARSRRERPIEAGPQGKVDDPLESRPRTHWIEPIPDAAVLPEDADPATKVMLRQSIRLAFIAALQRLPPRQRAVLLLTEVLDFSAAEVAATLDTSIAAANSALQRARATLALHPHSAAPPVLAKAEAELLDRYVAAFERYDIAALTALLTQEAVLSMPPYTLWLRGPDAIATWLGGRGALCRGSRLILTTACGSPAFGQYRQGGAQPWALIVLELAGDRVTAMTSFLDTGAVFPRFDLPAALA